jgi:hypothetical protein
MSENLKAVYGEQLTERILSASRRFAAVAVTLEGIAARAGQIGTPGTASAAVLAHDVVHEVAWGTANATIASIITAAAEYDRVVTYAPPPAAPAREPRRWPPGSPEPQEDGLVVRSTVNNVLFRYQPSWDCWRALPPTGDDNDYSWSEMNHREGDAMEFVEVLDTEGGAS